VVERGGDPPGQAAQPSISPDKVRRDLSADERGNDEGAYVTFHSYRRPYWVLVVLLTLIAAVAAIVVVSPGNALLRVGFAMMGAIALLLTLAFGRMARWPVRLEIGAQGIQLFARSGTTWIPWSVIERIGVRRVQGVPHVVAWLREAEIFPDFDSLGGGPRYLPQLGAVAVCSVSILHARRHEVVRALYTYAGGRAAQP
jgi:hypothetical protein